MGVWTWLTRIPAEGLLGVLADPDPAERFWLACAGRDPDIRPAGEIHTHRVWHALHVLLTGRQTGGCPPSTYVVEDGSTRLDWDGDGFTYAVVALTPDEVGAVAAYLEGVSFEELLAVRYPRMRAGGDLWVYSFGRWDGDKDMVQSGSLRRVFDDVTRFYCDAARAGDAVVKHRG